MDQVSVAVETACEESRGEPLAEMVRHVVAQFVDAKMVRTDISTALYRIAAEVGGAALVRRTEDRSRKALEATIKTAPDAVAKPEPFAIQMMFSAMAGATRTVLEAGASPMMVRKLREHLVLLCQCYLKALSDMPR
jgi:hypothetical protein